MTYAEPLWKPAHRPAAHGDAQGGCPGALSTAGLCAIAHKALPFVTTALFLGKSVPNPNSDPHGSSSTEPANLLHHDGMGPALGSLRCTWTAWTGRAVMAFNCPREGSAWILASSMAKQQAVGAVRHGVEQKPPITAVLKQSRCSELFPNYVPVHHSSRTHQQPNPRGQIAGGRFCPQTLVLWASSWLQSSLGALQGGRTPSCCRDSQ